MIVAFNTLKCQTAVVQVSHAPFNKQKTDARVKQCVSVNADDMRFMHHIIRSDVHIIIILHMIEWLMKQN